MIVQRKSIAEQWLLDANLDKISEKQHDNGRVLVVLVVLTQR